MSRTEKSFYNITVALIGQLLAILISFASRIFFIKILGNEYLGLSGLFTSILSVLSLVELGIGPAIVFSLYKPIAEKDQGKVHIIMNFYKKVYIVIGLIITIIGLLIIPFLDFFIKDKPDINNMFFIYILFLINTSVTYFFSYKKSLIIANQKEYIVNIYQYFFYFIMNIIQIIVLYLTRNFILFLLVQLFFTITENIAISIKANMLYPFIKGFTDEKVDKSTKEEIIKNTSGIMMNRIGGILTNSTDNLIISSYIGLITVGTYSNYLLISTALNKILGHIFSTLIPSIGNLVVDSSEKHIERTFNTIIFINLWIYSFACISLFILINPFITLWLGVENTLSNIFVFLFVLVFFFDGIRRTVVAFKSAYGLFWEDRFKPLLQAIVNLLVSIILVKRLGIVGVLIGTLASTLLVAFWIEPLVLFKYKLNFSLLKYFAKIFIFLLLSLSISGTIYFISTLIKLDGIIMFITQMALCVLIPNLIYLLLFYKTDEFKQIKNIIKTLYHNFKIKRNKI